MKKKKTGEYQKRTKNNNNNSKKCDTSYVSIWRVNKIMIQRRKKNIIIITSTETNNGTNMKWFEK